MLIQTMVHSYPFFSAFLYYYIVGKGKQALKKINLFLQISTGADDFSLQSVFVGIEGLLVSAYW